jgi:2-C-methyl-D-erythritol 4-phosphate cytidylyltransferase
MNYGVILAGGFGARMKTGDVPKQFLDLGGKPVLLHSLETFVSNAHIDSVYVGMHPDWVEYCRFAVRRFMGDISVGIVAGGSTRNETLINVLREMDRSRSLAPEDVVVTHDAARPFVTESLIDDNLRLMDDFEACTTAVRAVDTIIVSNDGKSIESIPNRASMFAAQTPQTFRPVRFMELYDSLEIRVQSSLTDACGVFSANGIPVGLVEGLARNLKITTPDDLSLARILYAREH